MSDLVKGYKRNTSMKLFLKSGYWPRRRHRLKIFFLFFSSGSHFVQRSETL